MSNEFLNAMTQKVGPCSQCGGHILKATPQRQNKDGSVAHIECWDKALAYVQAERPLVDAADLQAVADELEKRLEAVEADLKRPGVAGWASDYWGGQFRELIFAAEQLIALLPTEGKQP